MNPMELLPGTEVLVKVIIVDRAEDNRLLKAKGYIVRTSRGSLAYVEPEDIILNLKLLI